MKSPSSMRNGSCNTSKCRGKLQKMGMLYTHSPENGDAIHPFSKNARPISILPKKEVK
jgi:hypothetical protein